MGTRTSPLREWHEANGASFTEFGGWEMPVEFGSIREEHAAVRGEAGIFDVSHMGEIRVTGREAGALMELLTTNTMASLEPGDAQYAAITDEEGVLLDDTIGYCQGAEAYLFVPNAGHDDEMTARWETYRDRHGLSADVANVTEEYAMFAVQGPEAVARVDAVADAALTGVGRFNAVATEIAGVETWVARTGYTGEDGFELLVPWDEAETVWAAFECQACGLGARDTLRIEAGFLLSGQDFHPTENPRTPIEAGIAFAVDLDGDFVGRDVLATQTREGVTEEFVGVQLVERGVPRHGYAITDQAGSEIGVVTSGTMSPTLDEPIGLGYVDSAYSEPGTEVAVVIRGDSKKAKIQSTPFFDR